MDDKKISSFSDILEYTKENYTIFDSYLKTENVLNRYKHPCCPISGGKDSDIMLDVISRLDTDKKVKYVFFDTGIEYAATKKHLDYLERKYGVKIERVKAIKPIPISCRDYGQPFLSKYVSEMMMRLQKHGFQWENDTYENLIRKYPKCKVALAWWTNKKDEEYGGRSRFSITQNKWLKEFILSNPPQFRISNKCCYYAKKKPSHDFSQREQCDLEIVGVRKAEGGIRASAYKNCFSDNSDKNKISQYRPLFYYCEQDEIQYDELFDIQHSDCYVTYGLARTGCVGCPYSPRLNKELEVMEQFEPKLAKATKSVFKDSYEYTQKYRDFCRMMTRLEGSND